MKTITTQAGQATGSESSDCDLTVTRLKDGIEIRVSDHLGHHAIIVVEHRAFIELCQNVLDNWGEKESEE